MSLLTGKSMQFMVFSHNQVYIFFGHNRMVNNKLFLFTTTGQGHFAVLQATDQLLYMSLLRVVICILY